MNSPRAAAAGSLVIAVAAAWTAERVLRRRGEQADLRVAERAARTVADAAEAALAQSEQRLRTLVTATSNVVWSASPDGQMRQSDTWEAFTGQRTEQYVGPAMGGFDVIAEDDRERVAREWSDALRAGTAFETSYAMRRADGRVRRVRVVGVPLRSVDGEIVEWFGSLTDIESEVRAREELVEQSRLTETITENATSALFLMDAEGRPTYLNSSAQKMFGYTLDEISHATLHDAIHHTRPDGTPYPMSECPIDRALPERRWLQPYDDVFVRKDGSFVHVRAAASPIMSDGRPIGTVVEVQDVSAQNEMTEALAEVATRTALLVELSDELELDPTVAGRAARAASVIADRLGCHVELQLAHVDDPVVAGTAPARSGRGIAIELKARGGLLGIATISPPIDADLAQEIGGRVSIALDNARLYEHERQVSHALQIGLLGGPAPSVEGVEVSSAYRPGSDALEVGGDWYDVIVVDEGRVALVVGDVVGHNLEAAVAMGQLRGAVRALAMHASPIEVLRSVDGFIASTGVTTMLTMVYADLEPSTGVVRYACAGHPPPVVFGPSRAELLWEGRLPPLGFGLLDAGPAPDGPAHDIPVREGEFVLAADEVLVLYSDGLVERRGRPIDDALDLLVATGPRHLPFDAAFAERLTGSLLETSGPGAGHDDDACVLAVRLESGASRFAVDVPADLAELTAFRQRLRAWLAGAVPQPLTADVMLAVNEAVTNSIEHGYAGRADGIVRVRAGVRDRRLVVTVADDGTWDTSPSGPNRGRGLAIMSSTMDEVDVSRSAGGTTVTMSLRWR